MRWPLILGVAGSTAVGLTTGCGGYCPGFSWSQRSPAWVDLEIPVDATPWLVRPCDHRNAPFDCALVVGDATIPVKTRTTGACDGSESVGFTQTAIQTLRPEAPLPPGATLTLDCDHPDVDEYDWEYYTYGDYSPPETPFTLRVRASPVPAAPPGALDHLELQYTRDDPNLSCTGGDYIEVRIDFDAIFLRQGGYVEVVYPNGQVLEFSRKNVPGAAALPPSRGLLKFTPVAIDGERGETVIVDASQIPEELVYLPGCGIHPAPPASALLAPIAGLALVRRRRGRAP